MPDTPVTRPSLLVRVRDVDDREAWSEFVALYAPVIHSYARRRGLQDADAADLAQDVLIAISRNIAAFEYKPRLGRFRAWLFTVTRNTFLNLVKAGKRHPVATGDSDFQAMLNQQGEPDDRNSWEADWRKRVFEWAMQRARLVFEDSTWAAFSMVAIDGRPAKEAADKTGLSVGAVYIAKSRVTARIRQEIEELGDE